MAYIDPTEFSRMTQTQKDDYYASQNVASPTTNQKIEEINKTSGQIESVYSQPSGSLQRLEPLSLSSESGLNQLNQDQQTYNNLTYKPPTTTTTPKTTEPKTSVSDIVGDITSSPEDQELKNRLSTASSERDAAVAKLTNFDVSNDPALKSILDGITGEWNSRIAEMERVNKSRLGAISTTGVRLGSRYTGGAGGMMGGIIGEEERQGIERVAGLEAQKQSLLSQAKQAYEAKKWNQYSKLVDLAQQKYEETVTEVDKLQKATLEENKKRQEAQAQIQAEQETYENESAIGELMSQGMTDKLQIFNTLKKGGFNVKIEDVKKATDNLKMANDFFPGITGELQAAIKGGFVPPTTTLEEFAFVKDPTKALDMQEQRLRMAKLQKELSDNPGGMLDSNQKIVPKSSDARAINKEITASDAYKVVRKGQDSLQFLTDFEKLFNETGATSGVFSPRENSQLKAKYNATILNLKEFFNLGVLNGPDEKILRSVIPDPTNRSAALTVLSGGIYLPSASTKAGIENMKKQIETTLDDRFKSIHAQYGDYSSGAIGSLDDLNRIYIDQKIRLNPQVQILINENPNLTPDEVIEIIQ